MKLMLFLGYNCLALCCFPFLLLFVLLHILLKPRHARFYLQRLSLVLPETTRKTGKRAWVHAVSVGEVLACAPLIWRLKKNHVFVYLSTGTETGFETAKRRYAGVTLFYFPFDFSFASGRFLKRINPDVIMLVEMEIWPGFVRQAHKMGIPLYMVSGRMVEKDFLGYCRFKRFFNPVFSMFTGLYMQNRTYAQRIRTLCPRGRIKTLGNIKFDARPETEKSAVAELLPEGFNLCAVSTHRGEERLIIRAFQSLSAEFPQLRLVIVPRHPHRTGEIVRILRKRKISHTLRSKNEQCTTKVFLVDTVGEMTGIYDGCEIVIMGGSFTRKVGGHNIIEPALYGKCILCGNHMENFEDIHGLFKGNGALVSTGRDRLTDDLRTLIPDGPRVDRIGRRAFEVVRKNRGASQRIYAEIFNGSRATHGIGKDREHSHPKIRGCH